MKKTLILGVGMLVLGFVGNVNAQDSTNAKHKESKAERRESKAERKERERAEEHPNAMTKEQRNQIKMLEVQTELERKQISFDPLLTSAQRKVKINESRRNMRDKMKSILTPQQYANVMKKPKPVETQVLVARGPAGPIKYEDRTKTIIRTLNVTGDSVRLDFYDNGAVDGDSITVFYNNKIIVQHLLLLETPASFTIPIDRNNPKNEIVMYAENLGTEPPNTALMVVTDGATKYEVNVSSDLKKSGTIFLHPTAMVKK